MRAVITITQMPDGNIVLVGEGDFDFATHKDSVVARASIAAVDAASAIVDAEGGFNEPVLAGDTEALEMSNIKSARRLPKPSSKPQIKWLDGTV